MNEEQLVTVKYILIFVNGDVFVSALHSSNSHPLTLPSSFPVVITKPPQVTTYMENVTKRGELVRFYIECKNGDLWTANWLFYKNIIDEEL